MLSTDEIQRVKQKFGIIGVSDKLNRAVEVAVQVAKTDLSVLVVGESGVGKENIPRIIHAFSARKHNNYIAVNCGAIPEGTIDSELFGHEKGSFTGAISDRKGYFEEANGGTIFLDEIGEMPLSTQARLLRVLESGEFLRVGSSKILKTNVRVIAATNVDLPNAIRNGKFREDLYYRLNSVPINMPPLRERKEDIKLLFKKFAVDFADKYSMPCVRLTPDAEKMIMGLQWPGNVRQLKNFAEQISILSEEREISAEVLPRFLESMQNSPAVLAPAPLENAKSDNNSDFINHPFVKMTLESIKMLQKRVDELTANLQKLSGGRYPSVDNPINEDPSSSFQVDNLNPSVSPHIQKPTSKWNANGAEDAPVLVSDPEPPLTLKERERELIISALEKYDGNRRKVANELGMSERTLYRKIKDIFEQPKSNNT